MNSRSFAYLILLAGLLSSAAGFPVQDALENNKAGIWFAKEYENYFKSNTDDGKPPVIYGVSISPAALKIGAPRSEINAFVHDAVGLDMVYADIANRMNLMLDLNQDGRYTGYCGSNLPPGTYRVAIVAIARTSSGRSRSRVSPSWLRRCSPRARSSWRRSPERPPYFLRV